MTAPTAPKPDAGAGLELLTLPDTAAEQLRRRFGPGDAPLRLSYFCGPGDVLGTYRHWCEGRHDPRVPIITYSSMFFELVRRLNARAQVISSSCPDFDPGAGDRIDVRAFGWSRAALEGRLASEGGRVLLDVGDVVVTLLGAAGDGIDGGDLLV